MFMRSLTTYQPVKAVVKVDACTFIGFYISVGFDGFARLSSEQRHFQPSFRHRDQADWKTVVSRHSIQPRAKYIPLNKTVNLTKK